MIAFKPGLCTLECDVCMVRFRESDPPCKLNLWCQKLKGSLSCTR